MPTPSCEEVTDLLIEWSEGDQDALNKLMPLVYDDLRLVVCADAMKANSELTALRYNR